jgi:sulfur transfer protein SufE
MIDPFPLVHPQNSEGPFCRGLVPILTQIVAGDPLSTVKCHHPDTVFLLFPFRIN